MTKNHHPHSHARASQKSLIQALLITFVFMMVEVIGGLWSNSLALLSDGAHMLTDMGAIFLSLFATWIAQRLKTPKMSFGYHRAEVIGAFLSGLSIWGISGWLIHEAIFRIQSPPEVNGSIVFIIATIGLIANLMSMKILHPVQKNNLNVRAAYLHLLTDSLGSLGAMIAGAFLWITGWNTIDGIITILFSILMIVSSWNLLKESLQILMQSSPKHLDPLEIKDCLKKLKEVEEVHDLHTWTIASDQEAISVHLVSRSEKTVLKEAHELLLKKFKISHATIQIEHPDFFKPGTCHSCEENSVHFASSQNTNKESK